MEKEKKTEQKTTKSWRGQGSNLKLVSDSTEGAGISIQLSTNSMQKLVKQVI